MHSLLSPLSLLQGQQPWLGLSPLSLSAQSVNDYRYAPDKLLTQMPLLDTH